MPLPNMKRGTGTIEGLFKFGMYECMLFRDAQSDSAINYLFMLTFVRNGEKSPSLLITLEHNSLQEEMMMSFVGKIDGISESDVRENAKHPYLCLFDCDGRHSQVRIVKGGMTIEQFVREAFSIASKRLNIDEDPVEIDSSKMTAAKGPSVSIGVMLAIAILIAIVIFPPFTEHFMSPRGLVSGHGGWKYILQIGSDNTRFHTESINIGLWSLEIIIFTVVASVARVKKYLI